MSKKEKSLNKLSSAELLELAKSLTRGSIDGGTTRTELIRILKGTLSVEEIKRIGTRVGATEGIRARKRKQFLAVLVTSLILYSTLVIGSALILNNPNPKQISVEEKWSKTYNIGQYSTAAVEATLDGGYIIIGVVPSGGFTYETFLLKADSNGNMEWNERITEQYASCVDQTSDGGYIIGGTMPYEANPPNGWLVKTYSNGTVQWSNHQVGIGNNSILSVREASDGGFIIAGTYPMSGYIMYWFAKTDHLGNMLWYRVSGSYFNAYAFYAQETSDGRYIIGGATPQGILLIKTNSGGAQLWSHYYNDVYPGQLGKCIEQTSDGGCVIAGRVISYGSWGSGWALWLGKTDQDGNLQWQSTNTVNGSTITPCVQQTSDGGYILAVFKYSLDLTLPGSIVLVKTDSTGKLQWESLYRKEKGEPVLFIQQRPDGEYAVVGFSSTETWLAEVVPAPPSNLPIIIGAALAISGIAVATCLVLMGRRLKLSREGSTTNDETVVQSEKAPSAVSLAMFTSQGEMED